MKTGRQVRKKYKYYDGIGQDISKVDSAKTSRGFKKEHHGEGFRYFSKKI